MQSTMLEQIQRDRAAKRPVARVVALSSGRERLVYPFESDAADALSEAVRNAAVADKSQVFEDSEDRHFIQVFNPPLRMIVVGAVHIAQALVPMATIAGYEVTVVDPRRAFGSEFRFPGVTLTNDWPDAALDALAPDRRTAVITLTHDPKLDDPALTVALKSPAFYVGSLGSKKTHAARLERLRRAGFDDTAQARIDGPIGLAIGAKSPAEIAVSILAKVTQALRQPPPLTAETATAAASPEAVA